MQDTELVLFAGISDQALIEQYSEIKHKVIDITIDDETIYEATDFGKTITKLIKDANEARKEAIAPLKDAIADTEKPYDNLTIELKKLKVMVDGKIAPYLAEKRKKEEDRLRKEREAQLEALKKAQETKALDGNIEDVQAIEMAVEHVENMPIKATASVRGFTGASVSGKQNWKYEVIAEDNVPREYCEPSAGKIWRAVQSGIREIPGVRIWSVDGLTYR